MKRSIEITTSFLDVGGVLLTNGWGHQSRVSAAKAFDLDLTEMEDRHHLTFDTYEVGSLGIRGIRHTDYQSMCVQLASLGLQIGGGAIHGTR
jgi:hypothetical protein